MARYRVTKEPRDVYYVRCDNCGEEDGPYQSPPSPDRKTYCRRCEHYARANEAFAQYKEFLGAKIIGFRFNGNYETKTVGLLLQKGKRVVEISVLTEDECGSEFVLSFTAKRFSPDCYMSEPKKPPKRK